MNIDKFSDEISTHQVYGNTRNWVPVEVAEDGKCIFNALSMALIDTAELAPELRLCTCLELVDHPEIDKDGLSNDLKLVSPSYRQTYVDCGHPGGYGSAYTIQAATTVINRRTISSYPPLNGMLDPCENSQYNFLPKITTFKKKAI